MPNQDIQFVVISTDNNRKQLMQKQFKDLGIDLVFDIHYDEGITPNNSPYNLMSIYLPFEETLEILCCFLSHVKAMKWYLKNSKLPYLLLLEDDIAIQKINFTKNLLNLIPELEKQNFDYLSLGYLPLTISNNLLKHSAVEKNNNVYWNLYKIYLHVTWGTQAQLIPRKTVEFYLSLYDKPSLEEICKSIIIYLNENQFYYVNPPRLQIDSLNGLLKHQAIVFPPLIVELNNIKSLINEKDNHKNIWQNGEIRNLYKLSDYYSYNENNNRIVNNEFSFNENRVFRNAVELVCRFGSGACEKFKTK